MEQRDGSHLNTLAEDVAVGTGAQPLGEFRGHGLDIIAL